MNGMDDNPIPVVIHLRTACDGILFLQYLLSTKSEPAHNLLMVKPGMATEAKVCHKSVSAAVMTSVRFVAEPFFRALDVLSYVSATQYAPATI